MDPTVFWLADMGFGYFNGCYHYLSDTHYYQIDYSRTDQCYCIVGCQNHQRLRNSLDIDIAFRELGIVLTKAKPPWSIYDIQWSAWYCKHQSNVSHQIEKYDTGTQCILLDNKWYNMQDLAYLYVWCPTPIGIWSACRQP